MKTITNKGNKILHVGSLMLLPEESHELPKEYENNPVLDFFAKRGTICITEDIPPQEGAKDRVEENTPPQDDAKDSSEESTPPQEPAGEAAVDEKKRTHAIRQGKVREVWCMDLPSLCA